MSFSTYPYPPPKFPNERYTYIPAIPPQALLPIFPLSPSRNIAPKLSLRSPQPTSTHRHPDKDSSNPEWSLVLEGFQLYKHSAPCAFPRSQLDSTRPAGKAREDVFGDVTGTGIGSSSGSGAHLERPDHGDDKPKDLDTKKIRRKRAISQASSLATKLRRESVRLSEEDVRRRSLAEAEREGEKGEEPLHYLAVDRWVRQSKRDRPPPTDGDQVDRKCTKTTRARGTTLVCLHANGFHKEMWIPTLQGLLSLYSSGSELSGIKLKNATSRSRSTPADLNSDTSSSKLSASSTSHRAGHPTLTMNSSRRKTDTEIGIEIEEETEAEAKVEIDEILLVDIYNHAESYLLNDGRVGLVFDWQDVVSFWSFTLHLD
jgi:hypothetical protein